MKCTCKVSPLECAWRELSLTPACPGCLCTGALLQSWGMMRTKVQVHTEGWASPALCWLLALVRGFLSDSRVASAGVLNLGLAIVSVWESNPKRQWHGTSLFLFGLLYPFLHSVTKLQISPQTGTEMDPVVFACVFFLPFLWRINVNEFAMHLLLAILTWCGV